MEVFFTYCVNHNAIIISYPALSHKVDLGFIFLSNQSLYEWYHTLTKTKYFCMSHVLEGGENIFLLLFSETVFEEKIFRDIFRWIVYIRSDWRIEMFIV